MPQDPQVLRNTNCLVNIINILDRAGVLSPQDTLSLWHELIGQEGYNNLRKAASVSKRKLRETLDSIVIPQNTDVKLCDCSICNQPAHGNQCD